MLGPSWISLFEQIPTKYHDHLALTLVTGAEIIVQALLRLESDFAILRGRMSGSTDAGRVVVLPYDQIVNLAFTKIMLDPEVKAIFGTTMEPPTGQNSSGGSQEEVANAEGNGTNDQDGAETPNQGVFAPMRTVLNTPPPAAPAPAAGKNQPQAPSKSILLARLRARLAEQGK